MKKYRMKWAIELEKTVNAKSVQEAIEKIENVDCQHAGEYVTDSFVITDMDEIEEYGPYTICGIEISKRHAKKLAKSIYDILSKGPIRKQDVEIINQMKEIIKEEK